eukprot:COSAG02_NODE_7212_length_3117_cov_1.444997_3_plen_253_part_00
MGGAIFNGNINGRATAWMMVGMLIFAVMWESFTSYLERRFEDNKAHSEILSAYSSTFTGGHCALPSTCLASPGPPHQAACVFLVRAGKVYKELMILGFIAFNLIMGKELGIVTMNAETLHCFEFCDLLVSICVLVYVANCAISSSVMHIAQRDWDRVAHTSIITVIDDLDFYLGRLTGSRWRRFKHRFASEWRSDADSLDIITVDLRPSRSVLVAIETPSRIPHGPRPPCAAGRYLLTSAAHLYHAFAVVQR